MLFIMESFNAYFLGQKFDAVLNFSKPFKELCFYEAKILLYLL